MASTRAKFGFIKGSPIIDVAELPSLLSKGTPINPTGTYDKLYFNTNLSYDEVMEILNSLNYGESNSYAVIAYRDDDDPETLYALQIGDYGSIHGMGRNLIIAFAGTFMFAESAFPEFGIENQGWQSFNNPFDFSITGVLDEGNPDGVGLQNELLSSLISSTPFESAKEINTKALYRLPDGTLWHYNGQWNAVGGGGGSDEVLKLNLTDIGTTPMSDDVVNKVLEGKISKIKLTLMGDETGGYAITLEPSMNINEGGFSSCIFSNVNPYLLDEMKPWFFGITLDPESKVFMEVFDTMLLSKTDIAGIYSPVDMSSKSIKTVSTSDTFMGYTHNIVDFVNINADFSGNFSFADDIDKHKERTLYLKNLKSSLTYTISNDLGDATSGTTLYNNSKYNTSDIVKILNARVIKLTGITGNIILQYNYDSNIWTISDGFVGTISES